MVKVREHSSENFPKKHQKNSSVVVGGNFDKPVGQFQPKNKEFCNQISKNSKLSVFWGKTNFLTKKFFYLRRVQFWQVWREVYARNPKNSSSFFEIKHTNNFSSPKKVYFTDEIVWMQGMKNLKAGSITFFEKGSKFHSSKNWQLFFENSICQKKSVTLKRYLEQLECIFDNRTEIFFPHSEINWLKKFSKKNPTIHLVQLIESFTTLRIIYSGKTKSRSLLLSFWKKTVRWINFWKWFVLLLKFLTDTQNAILTSKLKNFHQKFQKFIFQSPWKLIEKLMKTILNFSGLVECKFDKDVESSLTKSPYPFDQTPNYEKFF